jgi:hypothetical protein
MAWVIPANGVVLRSAKPGIFDSLQYGSAGSGASSSGQFGEREWHTIGR